AAPTMTYARAEFNLPNNPVPPAILRQRRPPPVSIRQYRQSVTMPVTRFGSLFGRSLRRRKSADLPIGHEHVYRNIERSRRDDINDLVLQRKAARHAAECLLSQEPIIKAPPAAEPVPERIESKARHDHKIDQLKRKRRAGLRLPDALRVIHQLV